MESPSENEVVLTKTKKTQKRKHRATSPSRFGSTLQSLLDTSAPSHNPLSLRPSLAARHHDDALDRKARLHLAAERKLKEENGHALDVIGDWGAHSERALRKVAQRGVVKLFNAIQHAQVLADDAADPKNRKQKTSALVHSAHKHKGTHPITLDRDDFLSTIKAGGIVSTV